MSWRIRFLSESHVAARLPALQDECFLFPGLYLYLKCLVPYPSPDFEQNPGRELFDSLKIIFIRNQWIFSISLIVGMAYH